MTRKRGHATCMQAKVAGVERLRGAEELERCTSCIPRYAGERALAGFQDMHHPEYVNGVVVQRVVCCYVEYTSVECAVVASTIACCLRESDKLAEAEKMQTQVVYIGI